MYYFKPAAASWHSRLQRVQSADALIGKRVINSDGEEIGAIREIVLDIRAGRIVCAVLAFADVAGSDEKLFAVPWPALRLDADCESFVLNVSRHRLEQALQFDPKGPDLRAKATGRADRRTHPRWDELDES